MKKFIIQISILLLILYVIALPIDYVITKGLRSVNSMHFAVWNDIYNHQYMDNDMVILGASSAWVSYDTYMMDSLLGISTYNLGVDGHPWYMYKFRYDTYMEVARQPKYIVITLDRSTFQESLDEPYMREQFLPYPKLMWKLRHDKNFSIADFSFPYIRYIGYNDLQKVGIDAYFNGGENVEQGIGPLYKGFCARDIEWSIEDSTAIFTQQSEFSCTELVKEDIINFIQEQQSKGIKVYLCIYPVYRPYLKQCQEVDRFLLMCGEISITTNSQLMDFSDLWVVDDTSYFYNPTHLNRKGATIFTKEFCERIMMD